MPDDLQARCEIGQQQLMRTDYLDAEETLASVEQDAWGARDFDTLARVYMPLQEARRQRRQRCGEGVVCHDLVAQGPDDRIDGRLIVENYPHGQLLVAGWGTIEPAMEVRRLQREHKLYVDTFLAAAYAVGGGGVVVITPLEDVKLPDAQPSSIDDLMRRLPAHCIALNVDELPKGTKQGDTTTYAQVMAIWERLHTPFLAAADMQVDPVQKLEAYRKTQRVDYGCELAHQKASDVARQLRARSAEANMTYGDNSGRRGINMRMVIAIVIAVIGVIGYLSKRSVNPVTGETQFVSLSPAQEIALGLQAAPQMAQQMGGVVGPSDPRGTMVAEVGNRIVESSDAKKSPYVQNFHFHLLADPQTINAFALPGGQIFITTGLYDKLETEAQLAGVLGHEIGHVINRHAAEHMAKGELGGALATAVGVGASDEHGRGNAAAIAAQMANQMLQLKFSRSDESESDAYGLRYMAQAGYDPHAMLGVMQILRDASRGGRTPEILATHPLPQTRLDEIEAKLREMFPNGVPATLSQGKPLR